MNLTEKNNGQLIVPRKKRSDRDQIGEIFEVYKSAKTLADYQFYLLKFLHFVYEGDGAIQGSELFSLMAGVTEKDAEDYVVYLLKVRKLKKTSVNKILASLKSLYKEMELQFRYQNPFQKIKLFKVSRNLDLILKLSKEDINKIIGLYKIGNFQSFRNLIILQTLFYTGMRSSELLALKFKHVLEREHSYYLKLEKTKSGREQYKPLHDVLVKKLHEWRTFLLQLYPIPDMDPGERYIFPSRAERNVPLAYRSLYDVIRSMGKLIGKDISPHSIRHSIATELSLNGADLMEIRDFLGHADTRVSEVYVNARNLLEKKTINRIPSLVGDEDE
jgi:integrase/recombinase XerD